MWFSYHWAPFSKAKKVLCPGRTISSHVSPLRTQCHVLFNEYIQEEGWLRFGCLVYESWDIGEAIALFLLANGLFLILCKSVLAVHHFLGLSFFVFKLLLCIQTDGEQMPSEAYILHEENSTHVTWLSCINTSQWAISTSVLHHGKTCKLLRFATSSTKETPDRKGTSAIF